VIDDLKRQAILRRLATDLAVVSSEEHVQRPADMQCCSVFYDYPWPPVPGRTLPAVTFLCSTPCQHQHHKIDVFLA
jgi:hypothetical protein